MNSEPLIWLGPWADAEHPDSPRPEDHIDAAWDEWERNHIARHLENGYNLGAPLDGAEICSLCGMEVYRGFIRTDGVYAWRDGLAHYVGEHSVRLPDQFIDHVNRMDENLDELVFDGGLWWDGDPYQRGNEQNFVGD